MTKNNKIVLFLIGLLAFICEANGQQKEAYISEQKFTMEYCLNDCVVKRSKGIHVLIESKDGKMINMRSNRRGIIKVRDFIMDDSIRFTLKYDNIEITTAFFHSRVFKKGGLIRLGNISDYRLERSKFNKNETRKMELFTHGDLYPYVMTNQYVYECFEKNDSIKKLIYFIARPNIGGIGGVFYSYSFE